MANTIKQARGIKANMPILNAGQIYFCTDTKETYIGDGATNYLVNRETNVDGGAAASVYTTPQILDGGTA